MKIYTTILMLVLIGCAESASDAYERKRQHVKTTELPQGEVYDVVIDSCEYLIYSGTYKGSITHKANCKNH